MKVIYGDCSSGSHGEADAARDARMQLWLDAEPADDEEMVVDLRRLNKKATHYDVFWEVMAAFLDHHEMKVNARRHGSTCETPIAWSVGSLIREVKDYAADLEVNNGKFKALDGDQIPSEQWLRMAFCPSNPWVAYARFYQCKFDVRFKLLSRNAVNEHMDGAYCARLLKFMRHLAVDLCDILPPGAVIFVCGDDKSSFKIGEPGDAVAVLQRSKGCWQGSHSAQASMHDFAAFKGNPSVWLITVIPDDVNESWCRGKVYVSVNLPAIDSAATCHRVE